ncbi:MAG: SPOR domain-containing protein [Bacteroidota bacterium]|nr:SPOR domain-containing protein [Bacteroidota bacterium]
MELRYTRALLPGMFLDYDCVIIPGFGGFVCNDRPAWYDDDKEEMVPPSRDVLFNPNLTHNDGLLAQEIIRSSGLSFSEAMKLAKEEAAFITAELLGGNQVEIQGVGRLYAGEDGVNRFTPDAELVRTLSSFGHSRIPLAKLQAKQIVKPLNKTEEQQKKETGVIPMQPLSRKIARVAAILALPLTAGAIIGGTYLATDNDSQSTLLSLFPSPEAIISSFSPSESSALIDLESVTTEVTDELNIDYVEETVVAKITPTPKINFLIVGGAFAIEENAHTLADELRKEGYSPTFHYQKHNKLHLVALGEFTEELAAREEMAKARKAGRKASWLKKLR